MLLAPLLLSAAGLAPQADPADLREARTALEEVLTRNILEWWFPRTLDREQGGYALNHDREGRYRGPGNKAIVTQARVVWFLSRMARTRYGKPEHLEGARHGVAFLRNRMWDADHGGFYWEVDASGTRPTRPEKHLYGQAFGLYALSEYAIASGDEPAKDLAGRLFRLLDCRAHDPRYGGYREFFRRDWSDPEEETPCPMGKTPPGTKLMNTHLHLMEALTTYYAMSRDPVARERLLELISVQSVSVVRPAAGACTDKFAPDWTPLPGYDRISYGHDVENVWLLIDACGTAGISVGPLRGVLEMLFDTSLRYGFDEKEGGFYDTGPFGGPADRRAKIWWVQAEGLAAALHLYRLTGRERYRDCFRKTLEWILKHQVDRENGDWHAHIAPDGKITGDKAGPWKGPYHQGRAMIVGLELLERLPP